MSLKLKRAVVLSACALLCSVSLVCAQVSSPFTVLSNNADIANKKLYVELMYEKPACGDYKAIFKLASKGNPTGTGIAVDSFLNNPGTYETELSGANKYKSLMRPKAGGYRLRFALPASASVDSAYHICVESFLMAYRCVGCGAGGSDAIFGPQDIAADCPYPNAATDKNLIACAKRESQAGNWEAWIYDPRDCQPYRMVQMGNGSWWMAQNLNWGEAGKCYNSSLTKCSSTEGRLYTWYEAITGVKNAAMYGQYIPTNANVGPQGVCPPGYHVPTEAEWSAIGSSTTNIKGLTNALDNWDLGGMREMRDSIGFSWRPTPVEAVVGAAGTSAKQGMMWTVPATWDNYYAISRATPLSNKNTWGSNVTTADNKQGTKFDYLPVRCVKGVGEAVKPNGEATLQEVGTVTISTTSSSTLASGAQVRLSARATNLPQLAAYKWIAIPTTVNAPQWVLATTSTPDLITTTSNLTSNDAKYDIKVVIIAIGYASKESSNSISITIKGGCTPVTQGSMNDQFACPGSAITFSPNVSGGNNIYSYQWQQSSDRATWVNASGGSTNANYTTQNMVAGAAKTYYRRIVTTCSGGVTHVSEEGSASAYSELRQPSGAGRVLSCIGSTHVLDFGTPTGGNGVYTYQWQSAPNLSQVSESSWSDISTSGNNSTYIATQTSAAILYRRIVRTCNATVSNASSEYYVIPTGWSVTTPTQVNVAPNQTSITISTSVSYASDVNYQWQYADATGGPWTNIGGNTASIGVTAQATANTYRYYRCNITGTCNGTVSYTTPNGWTYTNCNLSQNTVASQRVCPGQSVTLNPGVVSNVTYQWQMSRDFIDANFTDISGATSATYTLTTPNKLDTSFYVRRVITSTICTGVSHKGGTTMICTDGGSTRITQANPPSLLNICEGTAENYAPSTSGGNGTITYQWQSSNDGLNFSNISGQTSAAITFSGAVGTISTSYYRRLATSCNITLTTTPFKVAFMPKDFTITPTPNQISALNGRATKISASVYNAVNPKLQWQSSSDDVSWSNVSNATDSVILVTAPSANFTYSNYYRLKVENACGVVKYSNATRLYTDNPTCPKYDGSDMVVNSCVQRTSGRLNWEAYIRDTRDGKAYRVVHMPDGNWWMAENLRLNNGTFETLCIDNCEGWRGYHYHPRDRGNGLCPNGWILPAHDEIKSMLSTIPIAESKSTTGAWSTPGTDSYGFSAVNSQKYHAYGRWWYFGNYYILRETANCYYYLGETGYGDGYGDPGGHCVEPTYQTVRCMRRNASTKINSVNTIAVGATTLGLHVETTWGDLNSTWSHTWSVTADDGGAARISISSTPTANAEISATISGLTAADVGRTFTVRVSSKASDMPTPIIATKKITIVTAACPYVGGDMQSCTQRTAGASNWQVTIRDSRDGRDYQAVQMPNGQWWFAEDFQGNVGSNQIYSVDNKRYYNFAQSRDNLCPTGWKVASLSQFTTLYNTFCNAPYCSNLKSNTGWTGATYQANGDNFYGLSINPTFRVCGVGGWDATTNIVYYLTLDANTVYHFYYPSLMNAGGYYTNYCTGNGANAIRCVKE